MLLGTDVHLEWPAGGVGDRREEMVVVVDDPVAAGVVVEQPASEALAVLGPVPLVARQLLPGDRREMVERVDLAVEVRERRADVAAVILECHHELPALGPQLTGAVAPHRDDVGELLRRQLGEVGDVVLRVHDDEAPAERGSREASVTWPDVGGEWRQRREPVVEHGELVRPGQLGTARAQRTRRRGFAGCRGARPDVAGRRDEHPAAGEAIEAPVEVTRIVAGVGRLPRDRLDGRVGDVAVQGERPAVGVSDVAALHDGSRSDTASTEMRCSDSGSDEGTRTPWAAS